MEESYQNVCGSSFLSILSGLCTFFEYSCVEPRKACSERKIHMKRIITIILALIMTLFTAPNRSADQPPVTAVKTPQTAIITQMEQVPEESEKPVETALVSDVKKAETKKEATPEEEPTVQETITEESIEIAEETIITEPEEDNVEFIDEGDQSLAEYKPQIGSQPNPFENDMPTDIDDRPVEDYVGEGEDRPGEGIHF